MSICRQARRYIPGYLDGVLSEADRSALEAHLHGCERCRAEVESLRRSLDALDRCARYYHEALEVPDLWASVASRIRENERGNLWSVWPLRAAVVAALAAVVVLAFTWTGPAPDEGARRQIAKRLPAPAQKHAEPVGESVGPVVQKEPVVKRTEREASAVLGTSKKGRGARLPVRAEAVRPAVRRPVQRQVEPAVHPPEKPDAVRQEPASSGPSLLAALHDTAVESVTTPASVAKAGLEEMSATADLTASEALDKLRIAALMTGASYGNGAHASGEM